MAVVLHSAWGQYVWEADAYILQLLPQLFQSVSLIRLHDNFWGSIIARASVMFSVLRLVLHLSCLDLTAF